MDILEVDGDALYSERFFEAEAMGFGRDELPFESCNECVVEDESVEDCEEAGE